MYCLRVITFVVPAEGVFFDTPQSAIRFCGLFLASILNKASTRLASLSSLERNEPRYREIAWWYAAGADNVPA